MKYSGIILTGVATAMLTIACGWSLRDWQYYAFVLPACAVIGGVIGFVSANTASD